MGEEKKKHIWIWVILIIVMIISVAVIFNFLPQKNNKIEKLSTEDFQILSASWDEYKMGWVGNSYIGEINHPINWNETCDYCRNGIFGGNAPQTVPIEERCTYANYHLTLYASTQLICNVAIDGLNTENLNTVDKYSENMVVYNGTTNTGVSLLYKGKIISNLDTRIPHDIVVCCAADNTQKQNNIICNSISLPAKC